MYAKPSGIGHFCGPGVEQLLLARFREMNTIMAIMRKGVRLMVVTAALVAPLGACNKSDEGLTQRLMESNEKVVACQKELAGAKSEIAGLKRQVADALANPGKITLTDPDIIQLVASRKAERGVPAGDVEPTLDPREASRIVMRGAPAMQGCYEKALKKNSALQFQAGLAVTLGITVKPSGEVEGVDVSPTVDKDMSQCFKNTVGHWKFPTFTGKAVTIEQKLTLTPKT
jgi:hypothetical protein